MYSCATGNTSCCVVNPNLVGSRTVIISARLASNLGLDPEGWLFITNTPDPDLQHGFKVTKYKVRLPKHSNKAFLLCIALNLSSADYYCLKIIPAKRDNIFYVLKSLYVALFLILLTEVIG